MKLIVAFILAAANGDGGLQAAVLKIYFEDGGPSVSRSAAYGWSYKRLAKVLAKIALNCLELTRNKAVDLPGFLGKYVGDWWIVDSTTGKVDDKVREKYPGTGEYAAVKVHKTLSLGVGAVIDYHFSPAREHDSKHLYIDEKWRGNGLIADLAYASFDTFKSCIEYDVQFVFRLKSGWRAKVSKINRGTVKKVLVGEKEFDLVVNENIALQGKVIDLGASLEKMDK